MIDLFDTWKTGIDRSLRAYIGEKQAELAAINEWGRDVCERLIDFSARGKMIRGGLIVAGCDMFGGSTDDTTYQAAAAMELLQSSFLIHDDIMDRDELRRGSPTLFRQYGLLGGERSIADADHFGASQAICAGDVAFFFAFDLLSRLDLPPERHGKVLGIANSAVIETCVAQMQDVYLGSLSAPAPVGEQDVLQVYHYKTGRYTFTLPLQIGAVMAGADTQVLPPLAALGEVLGLIFQIKDDELGLFGDEKQIGKPVGSDIQEGKKTIFYVYLREALEKSGTAEMGRLFGAAATPDAVARVRELVESLGVRERVTRKIDELARRAREQIASLPGAGEDGRTLLTALLDYNLGRAR